MEKPDRRVVLEITERAETTMAHSSLEFLTPKHIQVDQASPTQASVVLEPLERGLVIRSAMHCAVFCFHLCLVVQL